jgi:cytidyltransferase-like protein
MVSGCFDLLHSGHVAFLEQANELGDLTVCIGSDRTVFDLKGRAPVTNEDERAYMLRALGCVDEVVISKGSGILDFLPEVERIKPDLFFVNGDGDSESKREAIVSRGIEYQVASRLPHGQLAPRSTTALRKQHVVPFRLDLAGGWLDQPFVGKLAAGPMATISLEPDDRYERRSGLASSTRQRAMTIWGPRLPVDDREKLAKLLFAYENPPGTKDVSGSQDAIGIVYPGLNRLDYAGEYWPKKITPCLDSDVLSFLESHLYFAFVQPRPGEFEVLDHQNITQAAAGRLAEAGNLFWEAALAKDAAATGQAITDSFDAQVEMFPLMRNPEIDAVIREHEDDVLGYKISGAGGGGYVVFFSEKEIPNAIRPTIRSE